MSVLAMLFLLMVLAIAGLPFVIVKQAANLAHSKFRSRLWEIRDSLVLDTLTDELDLNDGTRALFGLLDDHILHTRRHTFSDVLIAVLVLREEEAMPSIGDRILARCSTGEQRVRLQGHVDDFLDACHRHVMWGSPLGWLVNAVYTVRRRILPRKRKVSSLLRDAAVVEAVEMPRFVPAKPMGVPDGLGAFARTNR